LDIAKINAWKVECTNSSGEILFSKTSYMWL
jgi:hypothetical protein